MSTHGSYSPVLYNHVSNFSKTLERNPLVGRVREKQYNAYRDAPMAIPGAGDWTGIGTRLLAMRRPDRFLYGDIAIAVGFLRASRSMLGAGTDPDRLADRAAAGTGG